mgnify:CR=1 FL=1
MRTDFHFLFAVEWRDAQGEQLIYAGWGTIGGGMALSITGGMIMWLGGVAEENYDKVIR